MRTCTKVYSSKGSYSYNCCFEWSADVDILKSDRRPISLNPFHPHVDVSEWYTEIPLFECVSRWESLQFIFFSVLPVVYRGKSEQTLSISGYTPFRCGCILLCQLLRTSVVVSNVMDATDDWEESNFKVVSIR